jgi:hypothetical protein
MVRCRLKRLWTPVAANVAFAFERFCEPKAFLTLSRRRSYHRTGLLVFGVLPCTWVK